MMSFHVSHDLQTKFSYIFDNTNAEFQWFKSTFTNGCFNVTIAALNSKLLAQPVINAQCYSWTKAVQRFG